MIWASKIQLYGEFLELNSRELLVEVSSMHRTGHSLPAASLLRNDSRLKTTHCFAPRDVHNRPGRLRLQLRGRSCYDRNDPRLKTTPTLYSSRPIRLCIAHPLFPPQEEIGFMTQLLTRTSQNALLLFTGLTWLEAPTLLTSRGIAPADARRKILMNKGIEKWLNIYSFEILTTDISIRIICALISTLCFGTVFGFAGGAIIERQRIVALIIFLIHSYNQIGFTGSSGKIMSTTILLFIIFLLSYFFRADKSITVANIFTLCLFFYARQMFRFTTCVHPFPTPILRVLGGVIRWGKELPTRCEAARSVATSLECGICGSNSAALIVSVST